MRTNCACKTDCESCQRGIYAPMMQPLPCDYCDENYGGSHYHCGNCLDPKPTSMLGHYRNGRFTCDPSDG